MNEMRFYFLIYSIFIVYCECIDNYIDRYIDNHILLTSSLSTNYRTAKNVDYVCDVSHALVLFASALF